MCKIPFSSHKRHLASIVYNYTSHLSIGVARGINEVIYSPIKRSVNTPDTIFLLNNLPLKDSIDITK